MPWVEVFAAFLVCHLAGDFLLQTDWQAKHKRRGLAGDPVSRRALLSHIATYTLAFVPALVWIADEAGGWVVAVAALISLPHMVQDDGRLLERYIAKVKGPEAGSQLVVATAVDQSFHVVAMFLLALAVGEWA